jgi:uncharacterized protein (TIGR00299 family) protein
MKVAYLDCFSGISGDMFLGALLDAGLPFDVLEKTLGTLPLAGYALEGKREERNGLYGTQFVVRLENGKQGHRSLVDVVNIVQGSGLSREAKDKSIEIFESLALVEGNIHNRSPEEVQFHEVGAVDSIVDIVGTVFGIEFLGITSLFASSLPLGSGFVETQHGRIPIPAPATIALLQDIPVYDSGLKYELVTPTGAALVKGLSYSFGSMPPMTVECAGYGVGNRELADRPNLLRIIIGDDHSDGTVETVVILEANLDDTHPEWLGFVMDRLFEAGALDVVFCPIQMKKNRPGTQIQVMGHPQQMNGLMDILFRESTTLGIRFRYSQRKILQRSQVEIDSPWGSMKVKQVTQSDGSTFLQPEYESCRKIAEQNDIPLKEIYYWVMSLNMD